MRVVEPSPVEMKKPKKEPTSMKNRKREREGKRKSKSNFQEYLEMEMGGAVSREEDLEMERRLAKKLKMKKGKLGGDDGMDDLFAGLGFDGHFGSDDQTETYHLNLAGGMKLDKEKGKGKNKKGKKDTIKLEESNDASLEMGEKSDEPVFESEEEAKLNKKKSKKRKKKGKKGAMDLEESNDEGLETGEDSDRLLFESSDDVKLDKKKGKQKRKKSKKDAMELEETDNGGINTGEENGIVFESEDGDDRSVGVGEVDDEAVSGFKDEEPNVVKVPTESKGKYVPPSLRAAPSSESEEITQMRRRVRGMVLNFIFVWLYASHLSIVVLIGMNLLIWLNVFAMQ